MLTFLFALGAIWTLFWFVMLMLDSGKRTAFTDTKALCTTCANALKPTTATAKLTSSSEATNASARASAQTQKPAAAQKPAASLNTAATAHKTSAVEKPKQQTQKNVSKTPVTDKNDQANVTPLFETPSEKDDLKTIKGIGVVMEKTLNDLGITTFKQLAGFKQAEVKMVSDVLSESKAGFGDRIERDEWVDQAKSLLKKAS